MRVLLLTSHSIAEHDDLDMLTRAGADVFSIGAYTDPANPTDGKRPALPRARAHPELAAAVEARRAEMEARHGPPGPRIDWAKASLPDEVIGWADHIVVHHFPEAWVSGNWARIRSKYVTWRTCGQSDPALERLMRPYRTDGLRIVRYSPREADHFRSVGAFAGQDAVIRFGKDPADWSGWHGSDAVVGNVTQDMAGREACSPGFWRAATEGLPAQPAGPGSERLPGGIGELGYDAMRAYLRRVRAYLYTGTRPASYTLGLIEAMMTGVPVISIGKPDFGPLLEADEIAGTWADAAGARDELRMLLAGDEPGPMARDMSAWARERATDLFGLAARTREWQEYLGLPRVELAQAREAVTA